MCLLDSEPLVIDSKHGHWLIFDLLSMVHVRSKAFLKARALLDQGGP